MSITTRNALVGALLLAATTASADPHRVVLKQLDGTRALSDAADRALRDALEDYDLVSPKRWTAAENKARETASGPAALRLAARDTDTAAIIDGYFQERGRGTVLTVKIMDVVGGHELDPIEVKLDENGLSAKEAKKLKEGLAERLSWVDGALPKAKSPYDKRDLKGKRPADDTSDDGDATTPKQAKKDVATRPDDGNTVQRCYEVFGDCKKDPGVDPTAEPPHVPVRTSIGRVAAGMFVDSRSLLFDSDSVDTQQYSGVAGKGLTLSAELYPWPLKKYDGVLSGVGFTLGISKSAGAIVGVDSDEQSSDHVIDSSVIMAAVHWRQPLGDTVAIDSEVGFSRHAYTIEDPPTGFEVPDTTYKAVHVGAHVDLAVASKATVGFGFRYFYVTDGAGDLNAEMGGFGAGDTSGYAVDASFVIPLPKDLFVKGALEYKRFTTELVGTSDIAMEDNVQSATDSTMTGSLVLGKSF